MFTFAMLDRLTGRSLLALLSNIDDDRMMVELMFMMMIMTMPLIVMTMPIIVMRMMKIKMHA